MATVHDLASAEGTSRRQRLQAAAAKLHLTLASIAQEDSPVELLSSSESFVQQLRWKHDGAEQQLRRLSRALAQDGLRAQVCSPSLCGSEGAFDARLKAPDAARPTLRFCCSSEHSEEDISRLGDALRKALS